MLPSNQQLLEEIDKCKSTGVVSDVLAEMFVSIVEESVNDPLFREYPCYDDMKAQALYQLCRSWSKFNSSKSADPNAYLWQITRGAFCHTITKRSDSNRHTKSTT